MDGTFSGRIVLVEGDEVDVDLQIGSGKIRLATPFAEIGAWDLHTVEFSSNDTGGFDLTVGDDVVTFFPIDLDDFSAALEGRDTPDFGLTVVEDDQTDLFDGVESVDSDIEPYGNGADYDTAEFGSGFPDYQSPEFGTPEIDEQAEETDTEDTETEGVDIGSDWSDAEVAPSTDELSRESSDTSGSVSEVGSEDVVDDLMPPATIEELSAVVEDLRTDQVQPEADEETAAKPSRFGPSSRERLASAMSGFRDRQKTDDAPATDSDSETAPAETSTSGTTESGFLIPGDSGYAYPTDDAHLIEFDEELDTSTVADEILESQRSLRGGSKLKSVTPDRIRRVAIGFGILVAVVALGFAAPLVIDILRPESVESVVNTTPTTLLEVQPTVTNPTDETVPDETVDPFLDLDPIFEVSSNDFVNRWNDVATTVSPNLRFRTALPSGDFEAGFTEYIAVLGSVNENGRLDRFTLEIDPTGPSASDRLGMQALGVAVATVDPALDPSQRAELLSIMGLNVRNPILGGIDGSVNRNGNSYSLFYDSELVKLLLSVEPA